MMAESGTGKCKKPIRFLGKVSAAVFLLLAGIFVAGFLLNWVLGLTPGFQWSYHKIEPGMAREEIVRMLGEPDGESPEFRLSQYESFEEEYERAEESGSEYYCFWYRGIDTTFTIGFDKDDRVTMKASGGT